MIIEYICWTDLDSVAVELYTNYSDVISSLTNLALNTLLLLSKIFERIPSIIPRTSLTLLSFTGLISLNMLGRDWCKSWRDFQYAWHLKDYSSVALTALRVSMKGLDILLLCTSCVAATAALVGFAAASIAIYQVMQPIAIASLIAMMAQQIFDYFFNQSLINRLNSLTGEQQMSALAQQFNSLVAGESSDDVLAVDLLRQIDFWALENLPNSPLSYDRIKTLLTEQHQMTQDDIWLIARGNVVLAINKLYPRTIIQYGLTWLMSLNHTLNLINKKTSRPQIALESFSPFNARVLLPSSPRGFALSN